MNNPPTPNLPVHPHLADAVLAKKLADELSNVQAHVAQEAEYSQVLANLRELPSTPAVVAAQEAVRKAAAANEGRGRRVVHEWPELHEKAVGLVVALNASGVQPVRAAVGDGPEAGLGALTPHTMPAVADDAPPLGQPDLRHLRPSLRNWGPSIFEVLKFFLRGANPGPGMTEAHLVLMAPPEEEEQVRFELRQLVKTGYAVAVDEVFVKGKWYKTTEVYYQLSDEEKLRGMPVKRVAEAAPVVAPVESSKPMLPGEPDVAGLEEIADAGQSADANGAS